MSYPEGGPTTPVAGESQADSLLPIEQRISQLVTDIPQHNERGDLTYLIGGNAVANLFIPSLEPPERIHVVSFSQEVRDELLKRQDVSLADAGEVEARAGMTTLTIVRTAQTRGVQGNRVQIVNPGVLITNGLAPVPSDPRDARTKPWMDALKLTDRNKIVALIEYANQNPIIGAGWMDAAGEVRRTFYNHTDAADIFAKWWEIQAPIARRPMEESKARAESANPPHQVFPPVQ